MITVIMPVYNGEEFLEESINSVLNQTYKDFTLLILNDNSTDNTASILENFKNQDSRIQVITKTKNEGPANLRNEGIDKSETEFIALLDADDIALPERFKKQITYLNENPEVGVCGTWFTFFGDRKNKLVKHSVTNDELKVQFLHSCGIGNPTVMFRKSVLGGLKFEHQYVPAEDYGLWSQLIAKTKFYNIPESLLLYRWHDNNISQTKEENLRKSERQIKIKQLAALDIKATNPNILFYVNAVSLERNLQPEKIIKTIEAANDLLERNEQLKIYNESLLKKHIIKTILRTIRNASAFNKALLKSIKSHTIYYNKMSVIDKIQLYIKCQLTIKK